MNKNAKTLVVIDGKSVFYRGYYAMPNLSLPDGTPMGGVYGFAVMALEVLKKMQPDYVIVAWDKSKTNIRSRLKLYPQYKANRKPMPEDMREQIPYLHRLLEAFGWPLLECDDYEADDIMGTLAIDVKKDGIDTILITSDLDVLQVVNDHTKVAALKKGLTNVEMFDSKSFTEKYGISPTQFADVKALKGDTSDNIPGVKDVGEKTALDLIKTYDNLDNIYQHLDDLKPVLRGKLEQDKDMAYLSRKLVTIMLDAPVIFDKKQADVHNVEPQAVADILEKYKFRSLLKQIPANWQNAQEAEPKTQISPATGIVKGVPKPTDISSKEVVLYQYNQHLWLSPSKDSVYVFPLKQAEQFKQFLEDAQTIKIGHDIKETLKSLLKIGIHVPSIHHDTSVAAFLLNSLLREQSLSSLIGGEVDLNEPSQVISSIWQLYQEQSKELNEFKKVQQLAQGIEWPIIPVLADMEQRGIKLNTAYLSTMAKELADQITDIEQEIYGLADQEFNVSSPLQLADILYLKLNLPTQFIKKTKSGYSTAASELEKLQDLHPIVELIFKYREWTKLKSTYVDTLPQLVDSDSKLHTTYSLSVAPTGRLSSHDPNLQNIPIRTELGRRIRQAFVPGTGNVFIGADYSQFELRLAAALAKEPGMIKAFNEGADIHVDTAATMYGIAPEKVTKEQRYSAKAVNFGIMYGLGPHGLSQGTGMTMADSKIFIDKYFAIRPNIKKYLEETKQLAKEQGFVETLYGRRRPTPDVKSSNFIVREAAYRAAVNMPLQGTAADIMKLAMIELNKKLPENSHQLLQIHDSVLIEVPANEAESVAKLAQKIMESVNTDLPVKLKVDYAIGKTWGEL